MILSKAAIAAELSAGRIAIAPFDPARLNPASYSFAMGEALYEVLWRIEGDQVHFDWRAVPLVDGGWLLQPKTLYLATTEERIGTDHFAMRLIGRPQHGLVGVFLQVSADLGHHGAMHRWTLEIAAVRPTRLRPGQPIGQVSFWEMEGERSIYSGRFGQSDQPLQSTLHKEPMTWR